MKGKKRKERGRKRRKGKKKEKGKKEEKREKGVKGDDGLVKVWDDVDKSMAVITWRHVWSSQVKLR